MHWNKVLKGNLKLRYYKKDAKFEKISYRFWQNSCFYSVVSKQAGYFFQIFVAFSENWTLKKMSQSWYVWWINDWVNRFIWKVSFINMFCCTTISWFLGQNQLILCIIAENLTTAFIRGQLLWKWKQQPRSIGVLMDRTDKANVNFASSLKSNILLTASLLRF